jgi:hypothetical protein
LRFYPLADARGAWRWLVTAIWKPECKEGKVKTLDVEARLEYSRVAVAVLRALQNSDGEMCYGDFARAIGLVSVDETWKAWHRQQIADVLDLVAAAERQGRSAHIKPLQFHRIVTGDQKPVPDVNQTCKFETN